MKKLTTMFGVMALCASSVTMAHAGGGGAGFGGVVFFQCYFIQNGANPPHVLEVNDQFSDPTSEAIGQAKLLCAPADATVLNGQNITAISPIDADHITCYEVSTRGAPDSIVALTDPFGEQTVRVRNAKYVCVQAIKQCLEGC